MAMVSVAQPAGSISIVPVFDPAGVPFFSAVTWTSTRLPTG